VLEQDPFVENAETFVDVKGNLNLKIYQRQPILRVIDNNNLNYYLDKNGVKMPLSKYYSARVPIITGAVPPYVNDFLKQKKYALKDVFYLVQRLNADVFFAPMIQQIVIDAAGEFTIIPILGDQKIRIGTLDDLDEKLERLKIFYKEAMPYEGWRKYRSISVKYKGQIVCKKK
jgi:cell division protein FtsQ